MSDSNKRNGDSDDDLACADALEVGSTSSSVLSSELVSEPSLRSDAGSMDVIYDGACAVCRREVYRLRRRGYRNAMRFVDASDPMSHLSGVAADEMLERVHAPIGSLDESGELDEFDEAEAGVQAIRAGDQESDYGFLMAVTRVPGLSHGLVLGYRALARSRRWPGSSVVGGAAAASGVSKLAHVN